jgi:hypothetical protein
LSEKRHLIIIGGQRSGTTLLHRYLSSHPNILMSQPVQPEPKYFLHNVGSNIEDYRSSLFADAQADHLLLGEKSTSYYEHPQIIPLIKEMMPDVKLIFLIRNPLERALSNYFFSLENGLETRSLEEVFLENVPPPKTGLKISVDPFNYIGRGDYEFLLRPFANEFGSQLHVFPFEDLNFDYGCKRIIDFLELEYHPVLTDQKELVNASVRFNVSDEIRLRIASQYAPKRDSLEAFLKMDLSDWN